MTAALCNPRRALAYVDFLRVDSKVGSLEPESRVTHCGVLWADYLAFDQALGDDRSGPRLYYLDGDLEIVSTSPQHERIKCWLNGYFDEYFDRLEMHVDPRGHATVRDELASAVAEPDESWSFHREQTFPDLVLEVALNSGGIRKLDLYRRLAVSEVWFWRAGKIEAFALREDGSGYDPVANRGSRLLPGLDFRLLERCAAIRSWRQARLAFRVGLAAGK